VPSLKYIAQRLLSKTVLGAVVFLLPAYAIKWGQLHPHTNWSKYLASAWSVGIFNSPLGHLEFYGAHFRWQELACLLIYIAVWLQAEYLLAVFGPEDIPVKPFPRSRKELRTYFLDREQSMTSATTIFVFLYVAACALCERIQMGTIFGINQYLPEIRDLGIVVVTYLLFKTINILSESIQFNGMIVRTDLERCYVLFIGSLAGLSLAFGEWFPLLALPGARIATRWIFTALRENSDSSSQQLTEPKLEPEPQSDLKTAAESDLKSDSETAAETDLKTNLNPELKLVSSLNSNLDSKLELHSKIEPESEETTSLQPKQVGLIEPSPQSES
jgi:hypothetical protein